MKTVRAFLLEQAAGPGEQAEVEVFEAGARFPACEAPRPFLPPHQSSPPLGRVSVGLRCEGEGRTRYLSARVSVTGGYLEAASLVPPGTVLTPEHFSLRRGDLGALPPHALRRPEDAVGKVARRRLAPGTVLQRHHLDVQPLIERGERVSVESGGAGFLVRREGEALESGALGERIRVRLSRREVFTGIVSGPGRVGAGR